MVSHPDDPDVAPPGSLASRQVDAMVAAWRRGERPLVEDVLARHPELDDEARIRLVYEEYCLRLEAGMEADPAGFARRFPQWRDELEALFDGHRLMEAVPDPVPRPRVGETFAGFRLLAELGRGVSGQVFLASQPALADRPVVLKVAPRGRDEHLSLARLQHMNIVPLYSAQVPPGLDAQVLCMPFLGGASLAEVLGALEALPPARRTGRHLVEALDRIEARLPVALPALGPYRRYLARVSYVEAICWVGACLADGLQYAHDRDLVHMDIKPSNVLLASDGQPMLLDFHLARPPIVPGEPPPRWLGGTPGFMAPEQRRAVAAVRDGRAIEAGVDGRADVYSLARLLYRALGGPEPEPDDSAVPPLHRVNPRVSVGLSDIVDKGLRPDPGDRYRDAAALAADLRRHLDDLPLVGVANRSPAERWRKWRRRRPEALARTLTPLVTAATAVATAALLWVAYHQRVHDLEAALAEGRAALDGRRYSDALEAARRGLDLAGRWPAFGAYRRALDDERALAQRGAQAAELHRMVELVRLRHGIDPPPAEEAASLVGRGRAIWQARESLTRPIGGRRDPEVERTVRADLLDFALVWADLRVRQAPAGQSAEARREALGVLDEADALLGPSPALERDRLALAASLGRDAPPRPRTSRAAPAPTTDREHFELGRSYLRSGEVALADEQFRRGLELRPQDFWLSFYGGLCAYRLGRHVDAVGAFHACTALAPETAECFHNRALAYAALGQVDQAVRDYTRALQLNPSLSPAALNRGILRYGQGRLDEAAADLAQALATTDDRGARGVIHYNLALVELARNDRPGALAALGRAEDLGHAGARDLRRRLRP